MPKKTKSKDEEIDILDTMLTSLVDLLEKKGVITQEEWEQEIKKRLKT
jgi:mannitol/fructose-specific phosphotransferase system IIA component (Ntr-type)